MDSPAQDLKLIRARLEEARRAIEARLWSEAKRALEAAMALDPFEPGPHELMAAVMEGLHDPDAAETFRRRAKALRQERWQREVEAEIRGQHELMGGPRRHETL
jgi:Tfp pilus assembly protein PilF